MIFMASSEVEKALCEMLEKSLLDSGLNSDLAKAISQAGCERLVKPIVGKSSELISQTKTKVKRRVSKRAKILSKELAIVNKRARLKNGKLRKGWSQSRIMKTAQKLTNKVMRK